MTALAFMGPILGFPIRKIRTFFAKTDPHCTDQAGDDRCTDMSPSANNCQTPSGKPAIVLPTDHLEPDISLKEMATRLADIGAGLTSGCKATETDFLNLGRQLQTIHETSSQMTGLIVNAIKGEKGLAIDSVLEAVKTHSTSALDDLTRHQEKLRTDLGRIHPIMDDLAALMGMGGAFSNTSKHLKMVGLNISIESSRTDAAKEMFVALAEEIKDLSANVRTVADNIFEDSAVAQKTLSTAARDMAASMKRLDDLLCSSRQTVQDALDKVAALMRLTIDMLEDTGKETRHISDQVGQLVVSIQIHDNISQRAEHIQAALAETGAMIASVSGETDPGKLSDIHRQLCLQSMQIGHMAGDVGQAQRQGEAALTSLEQAVDRLAVNDNAAAPTGGGQGNPAIVDDLKTALNRLLSLFDSSTRRIAGLNKAKEETGRATAHLSQHMETVRNINFDIHLKALNAVIRATRLGDKGRAIEVLVNEMKELADQSNSFIKKVTAILVQISEATSRLNQDTDTDGDTGRTEDNAGYLRKSIDQFTSACSLFHQRSGQALQQSDALRQLLDEAKQHLAFLSRFKADIEDHRQSIGALIEALAPFADSSSGQADDTEAVMNRYTMEKERDIHRRVLDGSAGSAPADATQGASAAEPSGDNDDNTTFMEDNIELF